MQDITDVIVTSTQDNDNDVTYRVELKTRDGQSIPLTGWYSSGYQDKEQIAQLIQDFLALD